MFDVPGMFRRYGRPLFLGLRKFGIGFSLGTLHSRLPGLRLLFFGQFNDMIDSDVTCQRFAYVDILLGVIVNGHAEDLVIFKPRTFGLFYAVQNVGDTVVDVLAGIAEFDREPTVRPGQLFQIRLDALFESFSSFHNVKAVFILPTRVQSCRNARNSEAVSADRGDCPKARRRKEVFDGGNRRARSADK